MRILIAYDGSETADAAVDALQFSGLPTSGVHAIIISAADVFLPPQNGSKIPSKSDDIARSVDRTVQHAEEALHAAETLAMSAAERVRELFPSWEVGVHVSADPPAWAILDKAETWKPNLIILGSHGRTGVKRFVLGSVSMRVLHEATCSVRIVRERHQAPRAPYKVVVGVDNSADSLAAMEEVASRSWPLRTEIRLVTTIDLRGMSLLAYSSFAFEKMIKDTESEERQFAREMLEDNKKLYFDKQPNVSVEVRRGNPKHILVEEVLAWNADEIFLGATGKTGLERFLLGSVSAVVAEHVPCTVEIVRPKAVRKRHVAGRDHEHMEKKTHAKHHEKES